MYNTLEENAKRAKEAISYWDYKAGSATAEYNEYCAKADEIAGRAKERLHKTSAPEERAEKVDRLLASYKAKKLAWMNEIYSVSARVPSIMIAGPSNFPVRAKEKQQARLDTLMKEDPEYILDEIKGIGYNAKTIYSDDKNAVNRIKEKIESLKGAPDPYGNKSAEIRRLKGRLLQLAPEEFKEYQEGVTVNGVKSYNEIVNLWDGGKKHKSRYDPDGNEWYFDLFLDFYDGKRHYKEFMQIQVDESGKNLVRYNCEKRESELIPLTDEFKYILIIERISGSGNKAVIYKHLKSLIPKAQETEKTETEDNAITVNGEAARVVRNKEEMRLQLIFDGKPDEKTRNALKSNGFRWAPSCMAWQRLLNDNSEYVLKRLSD